MEIRHLSSFVAVARELSFTRAARRLHLAQPALSRQIQQLEDELGVRLLERSRHGVSLTEAGQAFLREACALLEQSEQAIRVARTINQAGSGQLNLAYVWGLFHSLVPPWLESFRQAHPEVAVHLLDLTATQQAEALRSGQLDAGFIGFAHEADAAGLLKKKVGSCQFLAVLPKGHSAARQRQVDLRTLSNDFFLGISEQAYPGASSYVMEACRSAGFRPRILQTVERGYTILGLVAAHCGVALLPESLRAVPHAGVVLRPLEHPVTAELYVAWRKTPVKPMLELFLNMLDTKPG